MTQVKGCATQACPECPWRRSNQGKRTKGGFYTKANLRRLWAGLRTAEAEGMTCHSTDPRGKATDAKPVEDLGADGQVECAGALLLVQRELRVFEKDPDNYNFRTGLSREGVMFWGVARSMLAGTLMGGDPMPIIPEDEDVQRVQAR